MDIIECHGRHLSVMAEGFKLKYLDDTAIVMTWWDSFNTSCWSLEEESKLKNSLANHWLAA